MVTARQKTTIRGGMMFGDVDLHDHHLQNYVYGKDVEKEYSAVKLSETTLVKLYGKSNGRYNLLVRYIEDKGVHLGTTCRYGWHKNVLVIVAGGIRYTKIGVHIYETK